MTNHLGEQNLRGVLRVSSNVGAAQFGLMLGAQRLYKYEKLFGPRNEFFRKRPRLFADFALTRRPHLCSVFKSALNAASVIWCASSRM